jgi:hypothetical protein
MNARSVTEWAAAGLALLSLVAVGGLGARVITLSHEVEDLRMLVSVALAQTQPPAPDPEPAPEARATAAAGRPADDSRAGRDRPAQETTGRRRAGRRLARHGPGRRPRR